MSEGLLLLLVGAGIGLVSSLIGAFVQHLLSLRAERKKRELDRKEKEAREVKLALWDESRDRNTEVVKSITMGPGPDLRAPAPDAVSTSQLMSKSGPITEEVLKASSGAQTTREQILEAFSEEQEEPEEPSE